MAVGLVLAGCSGNSEDAGAQESTSQSQQQGESPQMARPDSLQLLSSSEVSEEQIQKAARIAVAVQMSTRQDRMKLQKEMKRKYGNPQEMDSTEMVKARKEMRRRQMKMRKKQMQRLQKEAKEEGMSPQMFQRIMRSAQQDSTLQQRIQKAMKAQMKKQQPQMNQNPNQ